MSINSKRIRLLQSGEERVGPIVYWMSREHRVHDNWALLFAQQLAIKNNQELRVVFSLNPNFYNGTIRQYRFMLNGLQSVEAELNKYNIHFELLINTQVDALSQYLTNISPSNLITDFDSLRPMRNWKRELSKLISIPFYEVDSHNIVPAFLVSNKEEFAAYTIRPKIHKLLPELLDEFDQLVKMETRVKKNYSTTNWGNIFNSLVIDYSVKEVDWLHAGEEAAQTMLDKFLRNKLHNYVRDKNNPTIDGQSNLSPYLHFGHLSAQRIALNIKKYFPESINTEVFLEELIVRKELAENFCYFNNNYDSFEGFKDWAKTTLNDQRKVARDYLYTLEEFEYCKTHEDLWNAAQLEMVKTGKMHGYMRMYWAKKILEWSKSPEEAMRIAIYLNDKYELDGEDSNGYCGIAWSIGGIHDRAWFNRNVYGKIRYMNKNGCAKKFDIKEYLKKVHNS